MRRGELCEKRQYVCLLPLKSLVVCELLNFDCSKCVFLSPVRVEHRTVLVVSNAGRLLVIATPNTKHVASEAQKAKRFGKLWNF